MCVAVPMRIVEIDREKNIARADCSGVSLEVDISLVSPSTGDYVLVHAGCAVEVIKKETAQEINDLYAELEELFADEH